MGDYLRTGKLSQHQSQLSLYLYEVAHVNRVPACMAGIKASHIHLCRVADNTV